LAESSRKLILHDPATGVALSPFRSWAAVAVMVVGTSFMSLVVVALSPVLHEVAAHFGQGRDGKLVAQLIQAVPSIGIIIGAPISGWIVERISTRAFLLAILALFGLAGSAGLYLDDIWMLVTTRFLLGIAAAGIVTTTLFMIGEYFDADGRARILGYQSAVGAAAAMATILVAGQLADFGGWRAPFAIYLLALPLVAVAAFAIPAAPPRRSEPKQLGDRSSIVRLLPLLALIVALFVGSYMSTIQMSFLLASDDVTKPSIQSFVIAIGALMVTIGSASYGAIRLRLGDRWTLRLCGALLGGGIVVMGLGHIVPLVAFGCAISGIGIGIMNPQVNNMLLASAPQNARGRAVGLGYTARYLGNFLNPVIVHPLAVMFGIHAAFVMVGAAFAAAALLDSMQRRKAVA
jgi:MFS family permease